MDLAKVVSRPWVLDFSPLKNHKATHNFFCYTKYPVHIYINTGRSLVWIVWESHLAEKMARQGTTTKHMNNETKKRKREQRFDNLPTGQREGVLIESINYRLHVSRFWNTNIGDTIPPYIAKETMKKRKPKTPKSDQKRIQNQIWKQAAAAALVN